MIISVHNVTPAPLAGVIDLQTNVWQKQVVFEPGLRYSLVAPSGKGKTTFVHMVYGLRSDYTGDVKINQQNVKSIDADHWAYLRRDDISIVYQDLRLFGRLTGWENIQVKSVLYKNISTEKIRAMAVRLNVGAVIDKPSETMSYGERQRIGIIRALIQPFKWLLLDEPFSHLDKENARSASDLIAEEVRDRKAGMITTSLGGEEGLEYDVTLKL